MTQQKRAKERKKMEKAQKKRETRELKKLTKDDEIEGEEEELQLLDGPVYFKDFDIADIKI